MNSAMRGASQAERLATLETNWTAFLGDEGAFRQMKETVREQGKKIDRLSGLVMIGFGIVITVQFFLRH